MRSSGPSPAGAGYRGSNRIRNFAGAKATERKLKRQALRRSPQVAAAIERWWREVGHPGTGTVPKETFFTMYACVARSLLPDKKEESVRKMLNDEWAARTASNKAGGAVVGRSPAPATTNAAVAIWGSDAEVFEFRTPQLHCGSDDSESELAIEG